MTSLFSYDEESSTIPRECVILPNCGLAMLLVDLSKCQHLLPQDLLPNDLLPNDLLPNDLPPHALPSDPTDGHAAAGGAEGDAGMKAFGCQADTGAEGTPAKESIEDLVGR